MKRVVLNLCGIKSKGGINVAKNFIESNNHLSLFIIFDNEEFDEIIGNTSGAVSNVTETVLDHAEKFGPAGGADDSEQLIVR